jgi:uracil-DNA glycosylase
LGEESNSYQKLLLKKAFEIKRIVEEITFCAQRRKKKPYFPTGFPGADIFLVKLKPSSDEKSFLWEGREGEAMAKSLERLNIPVHKAFGTAVWKCLNCYDNCPFLFRELLVLEPEKILVFGKGVLQKLKRDLQVEIEWGKGKVYFFPFTSVICLPDLEDALNNENEKLYLWQQIKNFLKSD